MSSEIAAEPVRAKKSFREQLGGFGPVGIAAFAIIMLVSLSLAPIGGLLIVLWAWLSRTPPRDLGLVRPKSWIADILFGVALGVALKFAMKAVVLPLLGAPAVNQAFHYLASDRRSAIVFAAYAIFGAGFGEELIFRGFLFERSAKLFGSGTLQSILTLVVVTTLFALLHFKQGLGGIENAAVTGLVVGAVYLSNGRRLFPIMVAHATFDLTALAMILLNLELPVSKIVFG
jgi:membrane protease YdiL (CAAX protease family)